MAFSVQSTVDEILSDTRGLAILERHFPGLATHPLLRLVKHMKLEDVARFPQVRMNQSRFEAFMEELQKGPE